MLRTRRKALVFTNLAFAHAVIVFVELVNRTLGLGNCLLAAGLGPLVACFGFLGLTFTPLPVLIWRSIISRVCWENMGQKKKAHLMTSGSSASIGWVRIGVDESADCCGRGANGGTAPNVGWDGGGAVTAC